ncbi:hypothetical protein FA13DRAFT_1750078 [Coprinellus micaceus]|uniref:Uncharacterized protein n=1 Tax=Coprinellus micaceus TaxID=71717 RepID=A0A4Y7RBQ9_COPMI|nr:hypothetical protein FA13DRAFT_1750078 [Coprinellus micaceus]
MLAQSPLEIREREIKTEFLQLEEISQSLTALWTEYGVLHNSSIYVNRLPTEILRHIFSFCLTVPRLAGDGYYVYEEERPSTEVVLSHVCHHWRDIATPRTYLERSAPTSMDLFIHFNLSSHEDMTLLDTAALQVHRWRRFNWAQFQSALRDKEAAELEYFSFRPSMFVSAHTNSGHVLPIFTLGAPKLARVHLDSTVPYFFLPPLSNYIGPSSVTWNAFLDIVALPNLQSLSIGGEVLLAPTEERLNQPPPPLVRGPRLPAPLSLLPLCPQPRNPRPLSYAPPPRPNHPNASLCLPSLHTLHIIECANLSANYVQFLASGCPNIKHLSTSYYRPESGHLLSYLNQESEAGRIHWPELQTMTCYVDGTDTVGCTLTSVSNRLYLLWLTHLPHPFIVLQQECDIVPWTSVADILPSQWPVGGNVCVSQYDRSSQFNFAVDWNEF